MMKTNQRFKKSMLALAIGGVLTSALLSTPVISANTPATGGALPQLTQLIEQNSDAVVHIQTEGKKSGTEPSLNGNSTPRDWQRGLPEELRPFFRNFPFNGAPRPANAMGSGFIISNDGYIVTNAHVIDGAERVTVRMNDRRELDAKIIGQDKYSDIAVLKVDATGLPSVKLGDSDSLQVGQWVVAIGAPFGLDHTATQGIVSALSRSLPDGTYVPFIQTDVAVNPGNSGGPLFDLEGNVVGVNSQIYSRSGGYMGISFAIPANVVKNITEQLKTAGTVQRGWLGVQIQNLDQDLADSFNMKQPKGALVASVQADSPAQKAGVQAGDIIIGFQQSEVQSANHLPLLVGSAAVGSEVPLTVLRGGQEKSLNVTIEKLAGSDEKPVELASQSDEKRLGVAVTALNAEERKQLNLEAGLAIRNVAPGSAAAQAGLQAGDIIISVDNELMNTPDQLQGKVKQASEDRPLAVLIKRGPNKRFIAVQPKNA